MTVFDGLVLGIIIALSLTAALFFFKFWYTTRDKLFLAFAVAFGLEALSRVLSAFFSTPQEGSPQIYVIRLLGYLFLIAAIVLKNRKPRDRL